MWKQSPRARQGLPGTYSESPLQQHFQEQNFLLSYPEQTSLHAALLQQLRVHGRAFQGDSGQDAPRPVQHEEVTGSTLEGQHPDPPLTSALSFPNKSYWNHVPMTGLVVGLLSAACAFTGPPPPRG